MGLSRIATGSIALSLFLALISPLASIVSAADGAQGVQISPALVELNAAKDNTYTVNLRVTNVTDGDLTYSVSVEDFMAADETGAPKIVEDSNLPDTASIKSWLSIESDFTLGAHKEKNVDVTVTVPSNAEAGGHYGVLRFSGSTPNIETTGVGVTASAGVLFLVRVDGTITEKADLASFFTANNDGNQSWIFESAPINFAARIQNVGNVHVKPTGNIEISDMFGNVVATIPVNKDSSNVLPNSTRRFDVNFDQGWMFGQYTANLALGYGTTGQAITNTITFWVIPYKLILVGLLVLFTMVYMFKAMIKSYSKSIEEKIKHEIANKNKSKRKS